MPRKPLFIVNPAAGGGRARGVLPLVQTVVSGRDPSAEVVLTERAGHATELAYAGANAGFAPIVGVGGDGTLHEVANGLLQTTSCGVPLGVVPCGTGNDFVRSLGLPRDMREAIALAWDGANTTIDVASCGGRRFLNVGGVGFDARVARAASGMPALVRMGSLPYIAGVLREIIVNTTDELTLHLDDQVIQRRSLMVAVANLPYYAGGMMICPSASASDGLLDVCVVGGMSRRQMLTMLPKVFSGGHRNHPLVEFHRARTVRIAGLSRSEVQLDGELLDVSPVEFECIPAALRVIMPIDEVRKRALHRGK
jgi:diacylglycerol kinase (ATP)